MRGRPLSGPPSRPATAPPVGGPPELRSANVSYFWGVVQSVKDSSPNRNVAQSPETDRSS